MAGDEVKYIFKCPLCGEEFDNPLSLGVHLMSAHSNWKPEDMEKEVDEEPKKVEVPKKEDKEKEQKSDESL